MRHSGYTERLLYNMFCRTFLASSCPDHWKEEQPVVFFGLLLPGFQQQNMRIFVWSAVALLCPTCGMPALQRIMPTLDFCWLVTIVQLRPTTESRMGPVPIPARLC